MTKEHFTIFRGAFEVINLMKMDIANYEIKAVKPILMKQAVRYEREKFDEYLKENKGMFNRKFQAKVILKH